MRLTDPHGNEDKQSQIPDKTNCQHALFGEAQYIISFTDQGWALEQFLHIIQISFNMIHSVGV